MTRPRGQDSFSHLSQGRARARQRRIKPAPLLLPPLEIAPASGRLVYPSRGGTMMSRRFLDVEREGRGHALHQPGTEIRLAD